MPVASGMRPTYKPAFKDSPGNWAGVKPEQTSNRGTVNGNPGTRNYPPYRGSSSFGNHQAANSVNSCREFENMRCFPTNGDLKTPAYLSNTRVEGNNQGEKETPQARFNSGNFPAVYFPNLPPPPLPLYPHACPLPPQPFSAPPSGVNQNITASYYPTPALSYQRNFSAVYPVTSPFMPPFCGNGRALSSRNDKYANKTMLQKESAKKSNHKSVDTVAANNKLNDSNITDANNQNNTTENETVNILDEKEYPPLVRASTLPSARPPLLRSSAIHAARPTILDISGGRQMHKMFPGSSTDDDIDSGSPESIRIGSVSSDSGCMSDEVGSETDERALPDDVTKSQDELIPQTDNEEQYNSSGRVSTEASPATKDGSLDMVRNGQKGLDVVDCKSSLTCQMSYTNGTIPAHYTKTETTPVYRSTESEIKAVQQTIVTESTPTIQTSKTETTPLCCKQAQCNNTYMSVKDEIITTYQSIIRSKANVRPPIEKIPERFRLLLKDAAERASELRVRLEGAPLFMQVPSAPSEVVSSENIWPQSQQVDPSGVQSLDGKYSYVLIPAVQQGYISEAYSHIPVENYFCPTGESMLTSDGTMYYSEVQRVSSDNTNTYMVQPTDCMSQPMVVPVYLSAQPDLTGSQLEIAGSTSFMPEGQTLQYGGQQPYQVYIACPAGDYANPVVNPVPAPSYVYQVNDSQTTLYNSAYLTTDAAVVPQQPQQVQQQQ